LFLLYRFFCAEPQELFLRALNGIPIPAGEAADVPQLPFPGSRGIICAFPGNIYDKKADR